MKNILITIDGSQPSLRALQAALQMTPTDAKLHVVTVQAPVLSGNVQRFIPASDIEAYYQEEGEQTLLEARELLKNSSREIRFEVCVGQVAEAISDYVKEHHVDQLFMGTRGLGGFSGLVLGSVTTRVINLVDIPVTLIK